MSVLIVLQITNQITLFLLVVQFGLSGIARNEQLAHRERIRAASMFCCLTPLRKTKCSVSSSPHPNDMRAIILPIHNNRVQFCISHKWVCHKCLSAISQYLWCSVTWKWSNSGPLEGKYLHTHGDLVYTRCCLDEIKTNIDVL